ncbi:hypothetical protein PRIPAC_76219 [Pristionchus pacificus]|uniref:Protein CNPPD1 n=1 Tax=Pristionchus pacificus TaxID=54126 RepID=A0A454XNU0_PRIPA|nr:hypothetical protein PRIPAC_76219 [Pristionchus pacificus]|eukprot:PDM68423.1 hypothetical protein PRIPAC_43925 [Pristionchus pacificus]
MTPQLPNYKRVKQRIRRSLNFGGRAPRSLHLPLTEMMVEYFNQASPYDYLKPETSASISSCGFADTCTLVVAMCYLERLRQREKDAFEAANPTEMYLPALVLASKYLHDSDQEERVADADWADMAGMSKKELADLEWAFVKSIDWDVRVDEEEFNRRLAIIESWVASDFLAKYSFLTYNELTTLSTANGEKLRASLRLLLSALGLSLMIYSVAVASLLTLPLALPSTSSNDGGHFNSTLPDRHAALIARGSWIDDQEATVLPCLPLRPTVFLPPFLENSTTTVAANDIDPNPSFLSYILPQSSLIIT